MHEGVRFVCDGELCLCAFVSLRCVRGSGVDLSHGGNVSFCFSATCRLLGKFDV